VVVAVLVVACKFTKTATIHSRILIQIRPSKKKFVGQRWDTLAILSLPQTEFVRNPTLYSVFAVLSPSL